MRGSRSPIWASTFIQLRRPKLCRLWGFFPEYSDTTKVMPNAHTQEYPPMIRCSFRPWQHLKMINRHIPTHLAYPNRLCHPLLIHKFARSIYSFTQFIAVRRITYYQVKRVVKAFFLTPLLLYDRITYKGGVVNGNKSANTQMQTMWIYMDTTRTECSYMPGLQVTTME